MKHRQILLQVEAVQDLDAGFAFYESKESELGYYFIDSLLADLDALSFYAGIHPRYFGFFRMLSKRFPYAIYYDIQQEVVSVAAILNMRKDPLFIRKELGERKS